MPRARAAAIAALFAATACSHAATPEPRTAASEGEHRVSGRRAQVLVDRGAVLVDVRSEAEFLVRHIDGARNIPVDEIAQRADQLGERDTPIVVYCMSGRRSAEAARILDEAGFERIYDAGSMFGYGGGRHTPPPPRRARRWGTTD